MMPKPINRAVLRWAVLLLCGLPGLLQAESGKMLVEVQDAHEKPVLGVEIGVKGRGGSRITGSDGKAQLAVGADDKEGDGVVLQIVHSPPGKEYGLKHRAPGTDPAAPPRLP